MRGRAVTISPRGSRLRKVSHRSVPTLCSRSISSERISSTQSAGTAWGSVSRSPGRTSLVSAFSQRFVCSFPLIRITTPINYTESSIPSATALLVIESKICHEIGAGGCICFYAFNCEMLIIAPVLSFQRYQLSAASGRLFLIFTRDGPSNEDSDVVGAAGVERILQQGFADLTR